MTLKTPYTLLLVTLVLAACSSADDSLSDATEPAAAADQPIGFGAYIQRYASRSGATGILTKDGSGGTASLQEAGFGVLAYNTGTRHFTQLDVPNFMYNEHVTHNGLDWTYEPRKYWPNGEGTVNADGTASLPHRVSFFAYAPWVQVEEASGLVTDGGSVDAYDPKQGITAITRNAKTGDPLVRYDVSFDPMHRVDLCWAKPQMNLTKPTAASPLDEGGSLGMVPESDAKVQMQFAHALTAMNIQIDARFVEDVHGGQLDTDHTRIWVRSITVQGMTMRGLLNLNNANMTQPKWYQLDGVTGLDAMGVTVYDGRRDGFEAIMDAPSEIITGLNRNLVQTQPYEAQTIAGPEGDDHVITAPAATCGVTTQTVNLFGDGTVPTLMPVYIIPTGAPLRVTIVYDVETYDPKLVSNRLSDGTTPGSTIENNITAAVYTAGVPVQMQAGKFYTLNLHLGMRRVEAEATVCDWLTGAVVDIDDFDSTNSPISLDVNIINNYQDGETFEGNISVP